MVARITGPDPRVLDVLGDEVRERLSTVDNVVQPTRTWHRGLGRLMVRVDEQEAAARGWSVLGVSRLLAAGAEGILARDGCRARLVVTDPP